MINEVTKFRPWHWHWYLTRIVRDDDFIYRHYTNDCECTRCQAVRDGWRKYLRWVEDGEGSPPVNPAPKHPTNIVYLEP